MLVVRKLVSEYKGIKIIIMSATMQEDLLVKYFEEQFGFSNVSTPYFVGAQRYPVETYFIEDVGSLAEKSTVHWNKKQVTSCKALSVLISTLPPENMKKDMNSIPKVSDVNTIICTHVIISQCKLGESILVFLPGISDISKYFKAFHEYLESHELSKYFHVFILHSQVPLEGQKDVFLDPPPDTVHVILATNIAESSITLPKLRMVINFGIFHQLYYDQNRRISCLKKKWCSKASCAQRAGRAGRVFDGVAIHLLRRRFYELILPAYDQPEILNAQLSKLVLQAKVIGKKLGISSPFELLCEAIDRPSLKQIEVALDDLADIGAIVSIQGEEVCEDADITLLGYFSLSLSVDLTLCRLILFSVFFGIPFEGITIAASLSLYQDVFTLPSRAVANSEDNKYLQLLKRSTEARVSFDRGHYSEAVTVCNMFRAWIDFRNTHLCDPSVTAKHSLIRSFCRDNGIQWERLLQLESTVSHIASRVRTHFPKNHSLDKELLNLVSLTDYGQGGGLFQLPIETKSSKKKGRQFTKVIVHFCDDVLLIKALMVASFASQMIVGHREVSSDIPRIQKRARHILNTMESFSLDPELTLTMYNIPEPNFPSLQAMVSSLIPNRHTSVILSNDVGFITLLPEFGSNPKTKLMVQQAITRGENIVKIDTENSAWNPFMMEKSVVQEKLSPDLFHFWQFCERKPFWCISVTKDIFTRPYHPLQLDWKRLTPERELVTPVSWRYPSSFILDLDKSRESTYVAVCSTMQGCENSKIVKAKGVTVLPNSENCCSALLLMLAFQPLEADVNLMFDKSRGAIIGLKINGQLVPFHDSQFLTRDDLVRINALRKSFSNLLNSFCEDKSLFPMKEIANIPSLLDCVLSRRPGGLVTLPAEDENVTSCTKWYSVSYVSEAGQENDIGDNEVNFEEEIECPSPNSFSFYPQMSCDILKGVEIRDIPLNQLRVNHFFCSNRECTTSGTYCSCKGKKKSSRSHFKLSPLAKSFYPSGMNSNFSHQGIDLSLSGPTCPPPGLVCPPPGLVCPPTGPVCPPPGFKPHDRKKLHSSSDLGDQSYLNMESKSQSRMGSHSSRESQYRTDSQSRINSHSSMKSKSQSRIDSCSSMESKSQSRIDSRSSMESKSQSRIDSHFGQECSSGSLPEFRPVVQGSMPDLAVYQRCPTDIDPHTSKLSFDISHIQSFFPTFPGFGPVFTPLHDNFSPSVVSCTTNEDIARLSSLSQLDDARLVTIGSNRPSLSSVQESALVLFVNRLKQMMYHQKRSRVTPIDQAAALSIQEDVNKSPLSCAVTNNRDNVTEPRRCTPMSGYFTTEKSTISKVTNTCQEPSKCVSNSYLCNANLVPESPAVNDKELLTNNSSERFPVFTADNVPSSKKCVTQKRKSKVKDTAKMKSCSVNKCTDKDAQQNKQLLANDCGYEVDDTRLSLNEKGFRVSVSTSSGDFQQLSPTDAYLENYFSPGESSISGSCKNQRQIYSSYSDTQFDSVNVKPAERPCSSQLPYRSDPCAPFHLKERLPPSQTLLHAPSLSFHSEKPRYVTSTYIPPTAFSLMNQSCENLREPIKNVKRGKARWNQEAILQQTSARCISQYHARYQHPSWISNILCPPHRVDPALVYNCKLGEPGKGREVTGCDEVGMFPDICVDFIPPAGSILNTSPGKPKSRERHKKVPVHQMYGIKDLLVFDFIRHYLRIIGGVCRLDVLCGPVYKYLLTSLCIPCASIDKLPSSFFATYSKHLQVYGNSGSEEMLVKLRDKEQNSDVEVDGDSPQFKRDCADESVQVTEMLSCVTSEKEVDADISVMSGLRDVKSDVVTPVDGEDVMNEGSVEADKVADEQVVKGHKKKKACTISELDKSNKEDDKLFATSEQVGETALHDVIESEEMITVYRQAGEKVCKGNIPIESDIDCVDQKAGEKVCKENVPVESDVSCDERISILHKNRDSVTLRSENCALEEVIVGNLEDSVFIQPIPEETSERIMPHSVMVVENTSPTISNGTSEEKVLRISEKVVLRTSVEEVLAAGSDLQQDQSSDEDDHASMSSSEITAGIDSRGKSNSVPSELCAALWKHGLTSKEDLPKQSQSRSDEDKELRPLSEDVADGMSLVTEHSSSPLKAYLGEDSVSPPESFEMVDKIPDVESCSVSIPITPVISDPSAVVPVRAHVTSHTPLANDKIAVTKPPDLLHPRKTSCLDLFSHSESESPPIDQGDFREEPVSLSKVQLGDEKSSYKAHASDSLPKTPDKEGNVSFKASCTESGPNMNCGDAIVKKELTPPPTPVKSQPDSTPINTCCREGVASPKREFNLYNEVWPELESPKRRALLAGHSDRKPSPSFSETLACGLKSKSGLRGQEIHSSSPSRRNLMDSSSPSRRNLMDSSSPSQRNLMDSSSPSRRNLIDSSSPSRKNLISHSFIFKESAQPSTASNIVAKSSNFIRVMSPSNTILMSEAENVSTSSLKDNEGTDPVIISSIQDKEGADPVFTSSVQDKERAGPMITSSVQDNEGADPVITSSVQDNEGAGPMIASSVQDNEGADPVITSIQDSEGAGPMITSSVQDNEGEDPVITSIQDKEGAGPMITSSVQDNEGADPVITSIQDSEGAGPVITSSVQDNEGAGPMITSSVQDNGGIGIATEDDTFSIQDDEEVAVVEDGRLSVPPSQDIEGPVMSVSDTVSNDKVGSEFTRGWSCLDDMSRTTLPAPPGVLKDNTIPDNVDRFVDKKCDSVESFQFYYVGLGEMSNQGSEDPVSGQSSSVPRNSRGETRELYSTPLERDGLAVHCTSVPSVSKDERTKGVLKSHSFSSSRAIPDRKLYNPPKCDISLKNTSKRNSSFNTEHFIKFCQDRISRCGPQTSAALFKCYKSKHGTGYFIKRSFFLHHPQYFNCPENKESCISLGPVKIYLGPEEEKSRPGSESKSGVNSVLKEVVRVLRCSSRMMLFSEMLQDESLLRVLTCNKEMNFDKSFFKQRPEFEIFQNEFEKDSDDFYILLSEIDVISKSKSSVTYSEAGCRGQRGHLPGDRNKNIRKSCSDVTGAGGQKGRNHSPGYKPRGHQRGHSPEYRHRGQRGHSPKYYGHRGQRGHSPKYGHRGQRGHSPEYRYRGQRGCSPADSKYRVKKGRSSNDIGQKSEKKECSQRVSSPEKRDSFRKINTSEKTKQDYYCRKVDQTKQEDIFGVDHPETKKQEEGSVRKSEPPGKSGKKKREDDTRQFSCGDKATYSGQGRQDRKSKKISPEDSTYKWTTICERPQSEYEQNIL